MIVVDEFAEQKLAKLLENFQIGSDKMRSIYFGLSNKFSKNSDTRNLITAAASSYISSENKQIFLCEDGDIFILAPIILKQEARLLILEIAEKLKINTDEGSIAFYDVEIDINKLMVMTEKKLSQIRKAAEAKQIEQKNLQNERKKQIILKTVSNSEEIKQIRLKRQKLELMIIEDDTFSCKLVEKALDNKYHLTALHTADSALTTYGHLAPDLLFLDINLPDVTGHELLEKIMEMDKDAYVIMLSGNCDKKNILESMQKGAKGFIAKPFTRDKIFEYINRCPRKIG